MFKTMAEASEPRTTEQLIAAVHGRAERLAHVRRRHRGVIAVAVVALIAVGVVVGLTVPDSGSPGHASAAHGGRSSTERGSLIDPRAGRGGFTITPTQGLRNHQRVAVRIHGLEPEESVSVLMCAGVPRSFAAGQHVCSSIGQLNTHTNGRGAADLLFAVLQFVTLGWDYQVNCATYPSGCSIAVVDPDNIFAKGGTGNIEPVMFLPGAAPPTNGPTVSVTPSGPFTEGENVVVNGSGFPADVAVRVAECPVDADCSNLWKGVESSPAGTFSTELSIRHTFTFNGNPGPISIDCGQPLSCFIASETSSPGDVVIAPGIPVTFVSP